MPVAENQLFPTFELPNQSGQIVKNSDLTAPLTIIYFYPKDDTTGCTLEAKAFQSMANSVPGVQIVGVSPDNEISHQKFASKYGLEFILLADTEHKLAEATGVWVEKSMYGRKYMGVERTTFLVGSDGTIKRIWKKVTPAGHAQEVLEVAATLLK